MSRSLGFGANTFWDSFPLGCPLFLAQRTHNVTAVNFTTRQLAACYCRCRCLSGLGKSSNCLNFMVFQIDRPTGPDLDLDVDVDLARLCPFLGPRTSTKHQVAAEHASMTSGHESQLKLESFYDQRPEFGFGIGFGSASVFLYFFLFLFIFACPC